MNQTSYVKDIALVFIPVRLNQWQVRQIYPTAAPDLSKSTHPSPTHHSKLLMSSSMDSGVVADP